MKSEEKPSESGSNKKKPFNSNGNSNKVPVITKTKFEGDCEDLKGHIYDCSDSKKADLFVKTNKKLSEYVGKKFKEFPGDMQSLVKNLEMPTLVMPVDPEDKATKSEIRVWEKKCDSYAKREEALEQNIQRLYALVKGQCTESMIAALKGLSTYEDIDEKLDGLRLLLAIKSIVYMFQSQKSLPHAIHESVRRFYFLQQNKTDTAAAYLENFTNVVDVITATGGSIGNHKDILQAVADEEKLDLDTATPDELKSITATAKERYLAVAFLLSSDRTRYGRCIEELENSFLKGNDEYPRTVTAAFNLISKYKHDPRNMVRVVGQVNDGVSFTNVGSVESATVTVTETNAESDAPVQSSVALVVKGTSGTSKPHILCFRCQQKGHYANDCPEATQANGTTLLMAGISNGEFDQCDGFQFLNNHHEKVPSTWLLLDNQFTVDVFNNASVLKNIRELSTTMNIHCNAGIASTNQVGDLPGYGTVWYHPNGITNILSLSRVIEKGYHVTFDSKDGDNKFIVNKSDGSAPRIFTQSDTGLYYTDMKQSSSNGVALVSTVEENKTKYTNRDYSRALLARNIQKIIGRPSTRDFMKIVDNHLLPNCPITRRDIIAAEHIFGPDVGSLKGKTVRSTPIPVNMSLVDIPSTIMSHYREITLAGDIMFVNKVAFFVTVSRNLKFGTTEMLPNQQSKTLLGAIKQVKAIYSRRGFIITTLLMDGQFDVLRADLAEIQITLNTVSNDEHVPEVERHIRTLKERARAIYNVLPFPQLPTRMVIELIHYCTFWLNSFPAAHGVSDVLSPRAIVTGSRISYEAHCQLEFGSYVQTHEPHDNSMATRTTGALALRPTGNDQGGYYFFSLTTGRRLNRNNWTPLPMPADVIDRVRTFCRRDQANRAAGLQIFDRDGRPIPDPARADYDDDQSDTDDSDFDPLEHPDIAFDDDADDNDNDPIIVPIAGVNDDDANANYNDDANYNRIEQDDVVVDMMNNDNIAPMVQIDPNDLQGIEEAVENHGIVDIILENNDVPDEINPNDNVDLNAEMDHQYGNRTAAYNLRPRKPRDYSHLHTVLESTMMTQYSMKKGIEIFGDAGIEAILKELHQLHDRGVLEPANHTTMTPTERKAALAYLMFLKEKRTGEIKGRGCADGRKQRLHTNKEDASSPTVAIESVFLTSVIDAKENRDVATIDVPGAFMQADMDDTVHMKLEGTMADLLINLAPDIYKKFAYKHNGKTVLYVLLKKALYGTLKAALLFWKRLSSQLQEWGFTLNPYDSCVANKNIDGQQCTIIWHVDDLKISHIDPNVVTDVIKLIESEFGKEAPLTIRRGKVHDYLGMKINFSIPGKVQFTMEDYVKAVNSPWKIM